MQILAKLAEALRERLRVIEDQESRLDASRHMQRLKEASETLETIENQLPPTTHPQLRHFLERRSYSKALEFLETEKKTGDD
jgi:hypothetical protein